MAALRMAMGQVLRLVADVIDPPKTAEPVAWEASSAEPMGMYVLDFTRGEVRLDGQVIGHG